MTVRTHDAPRKTWGIHTLDRLLELTTASHGRAVATLVALALLAFLPGFFTIPPIDRDEARFAQATRQMVETGDFVDIRFQDEVRYKKPVGIYWLQAVALSTVEALGYRRAPMTIAVYRIPSLLGAVGAVLLTYWSALAFMRRRAAFLAGGMMATSILLGVEARLAKTDAMLLLAAVAAMGAMARIYLARNETQPAGRTGWATPAMFWSALAVGILLKGPLILMFAGLAALALVIADRDLRWLLRLRPLSGIAWMLLLVLPWFLAIMSRAGESFFIESIGRDLLQKVGSGQESHGAPPGLYLLLFWVTFWPGAALTLAALPTVWANRREDATRFLLAWIVPSWLVLEAVVTKLPHYVLPLYPAIAILIARAIDQDALSTVRWRVRATLWWPLLPLVLGIGGIVGLIMISRQPGFLAWPFVAGAVLFGVIAWHLYDSEGAERSLTRAGVASVLVSMAVYGVVVPRLDAAFPSATLSKFVRYAGCPNPLVASAGYHEPSLVLLTSTSTRLTDGGGAADFLKQGPCRIAFIETRHERAFAQRAQQIGLRYGTGGRIEAFNINGFRPITIAVYRSEASL